MFRAPLFMSRVVVVVVVYSTHMYNRFGLCLKHPAGSDHKIDADTDMRKCMFLTSVRVFIIVLLHSKMKWMASKIPWPRIRTAPKCQKCDSSNNWLCSRCRMTYLDALCLTFHEILLRFYHHNCVLCCYGFVSAHNSLGFVFMHFAVFSNASKVDGDVIFSILSSHQYSLRLLKKSYMLQLPLASVYIVT